MGRPLKVPKEDREVTLLLNGSHRLGIVLGLGISESKCDMAAYKWFHDHKVKVRAAGLETKALFVEKADGTIEIQME